MALLSNFLREKFSPKTKKTTPQTQAREAEPKTKTNFFLEPNQEHHKLQADRRVASARPFEILGLGSSFRSIRNFIDVGHRSSNPSLESKKPIKSDGGGLYTSSSSLSSSYSRGIQFKKCCSCYECQMVVDPTRLPNERNTVCPCSECGEVFPKVESLELHQAVRHAVSELDEEDSSRNIVEMIFKSNWLKGDDQMCTIERILKVHNAPRTIQLFEECRDTVKNCAHDSRCAADGNEQLRFHCTTLTCALGAHGSSALCGAVPGCGVCTIIRQGFHKGVRTNASSDRAHDVAVCDGDVTQRAMLVCRVIAGRVKQVAEEEELLSTAADADASYDSVASTDGIYPDFEEMFVFNPRAILPCFVVIYKVL